MVKKFYFLCFFSIVNGFFCNLSDIQDLLSTTLGRFIWEMNQSSCSNCSVLVCDFKWVIKYFSSVVDEIGRILNYITIAPYEEGNLFGFILSIFTGN